MGARLRLSRDGARPPDRAALRPDRARGRRARSGCGPCSARGGDPRDAVPARPLPPSAPRGAAPVNGRPGTDRRGYRTSRKRHQPLGPYGPGRTNDRKEIPVNPPAPPAPSSDVGGRPMTATSLERDPEAVDQLVARVLSRAHRTTEAVN